MDKINIIPPLHDVMVAKIFENMASAPAALSLINAVLADAGSEPLEEITSLRCEETLPGATLSGRGCRLDVVAKSKNKLVNLEVQRETYPDMIDRSIFHAGATWHNSLETAQRYSELPRMIMINLLDFKPLRPKHPDFHQPMGIVYLKGERETASDILYIHNIELQKFRQMTRKGYNKSDPLERWLYFLIKGYQTINETETKEVLGMDRGLQQFAEKYNLSLQDPLIQEKYTHHRFAELDYNSNMEFAEEKGILKGKIEGMEEMIRLALHRKVMSSAALMIMAEEAGISRERYNQIYQEEMASANRAKTKKRNDIER
jgi:predicted transposase/invertase (TIGR01784 family)